MSERHTISPVRARSARMRVPMVAMALGVALAGGAPGTARAPGGQPTARSMVEEARRLLETLKFDQVVSLLNTAIATMTSSPDPDLDGLALAYDLRGQAHYSLDDQEQARLDFELLLQVQVDYGLAADLPPRVVELFDGVKRRVVGLLMLSMPRPATVTIDGRAYQVERDAVIELLGGPHEFALNQPGYGDESVQITITPAVPTMFTAKMERVSGTLSVVTVPAGARVFVDDVLCGVTVSGTSGNETSAPLLVADLLPGQHRLRLERDCFVSYETGFSVATPPGDQATSPLELVPAVATVSVQTTAQDAMVYVDGESRGFAPAELPNLCEDEHVIEVRAPIGRFVDRRMWLAGAMATLDAELRPAFAIVEVAGSSDPGRGGARCQPRSADLHADTRRTRQRCPERAAEDGVVR